MEQLALLNKEKTVTCMHKDHYDLLSYHHYDHTYFTDEYINARQHSPTTCFACGKTMSSKTAPTGKEEDWYKVNLANPVMACKDAMDDRSTCCKAFCVPCHKKWSGLLGSKRRRTQATQILPGEKIGKHGVVQAAV